MIRLLFYGFLFCFTLSACKHGEHVDYATQVKPILNEHCITCHGGVRQNGGFSLLNRELALQNTESGRPAIIPYFPDSSEFIERLVSHDLEERMPYQKPPLDDQEIDLLRRWVKQGAEWGLHWAYEPLKPVTVDHPRLSSLSFFKQKNQANAIDHWINKALDEIGLKANPPATKSQLLRRVSLDISGIPASSSLSSSFLRKDNPISYEAVIDSLLALPSFGEKWATMWLDIARYADSKGFERDNNRSIWPYRDYVIKALNSDKPYDQFVIEQMAGDLLDHPTDEKLIATGFHRNTTTNDEGGTDNEEYRVQAVMDRVNTTWEGLLGTTFACIQCHGHPYDPFPHEAYYQSMAFLNNTRDADTHRDYPWLKLLDTVHAARLDSLKQWIGQVNSREQADEVAHFVRTLQPSMYSIETDELTNAALYDTKYLGLRKNGSARIPHVNLTNKSVLLVRSLSTLAGGRLNLFLDKHDGPLLGSINVQDTKWRYDIWEIALNPTQGIHDIYLVYEHNQLTDPKKMAVQFDWFYFTNPIASRQDPLYQEYWEYFKALVEYRGDYTLIMTENPTDRFRHTNIFDRGNWLTIGAEVEPEVPSIFPQIAQNHKVPRLAFAEWIVDKNNPLTARTFVNRVWEQLFGQGIVKTVEDLGSQGEQPTHPELLDDLAYRWIHDYDWSIKSLIKEIVLSDAYQRSSVANLISLKKDKDNQFLSRGPRIRLSAEQIRDQALAVSALLSSKMYGPPVMPYQPESVWSTPYNNESWKQSEGEDRYRRGIYTMIKRGAQYPSFTTFDMAQRQICTARRIRTNTPLQALVLLNDPTYTEVADQLAERMMRAGGDSLEDQINYAYRLFMFQDISSDKLNHLVALYDDTYTEITGREEASAEEAKKRALAIVATAFINLDEFLTN